MLTSPAATPGVAAAAGGRRRRLEATLKQADIRGTEAFGPTLSNAEESGILQFDASVAIQEEADRDLRADLVLGPGGAGGDDADVVVRVGERRRGGNRAADVDRFPDPDEQAG